MLLSHQITKTENWRKVDSLSFKHMEDTISMEKLNELTITDAKELANGRKVTVSSTDDSAIVVHMKEAIMIVDPDIGTDGKITLLEPDTGCKIELDSDKMINSIHGNENTIVIRFCNGMGGLDIAITGEKSCLIHPIDKEFDYKETVHEDFVSRIEFINRTGIFITPEHFEYIYDMEFKKANVSANDFVNNYEDKYANCIQEVLLNGIFKYEVMDEDLSCMGLYDEVYYPSIWEIINSLAISYNIENQSKWEFIEKYKSALEDNLKILDEIKTKLTGKK